MNRNEFSVTLVSNSSLWEYPDNTFMRFTNILNKELVLPVNEQWKVCLQSITMTCDIKSTYDESVVEELVKTRKNIGQQLSKKAPITTNLIKNDQSNLPTFSRQKLQQISHKVRTINKLIRREKQKKLLKDRILTVSSSIITPEFGNPPILAQFSVPSYDPITSSTITYQPETNSYFNLSSPSITEIDITICNSFGDKLKATSGQSSIVVLKFRKMQQDLMDYFTLRVESNENPLEFRAKLPDNLLKDGQLNPWEVALTKITYPPRFNAFPDQMCTVTIYQVREAFEHWVKNPKDEEWEAKAFYHKTIGTLKYPKSDKTLTPTKFVAFFKKILDAVCSEENWATMTYTINNGKLVLKSNKEILVQLPEYLYLALGISRHKTYPYGKGTIIHLKADQDYEADFKINPTLIIPKNLLVYADCVEPSLIGNEYGQYLTNVPVAVSELSQLTTSYEPKYLEFHPIHTGDLSNVHFRIIQTDGNVPYLAKNNLKTFITLLFRRKKKDK